MAGWRQVPGPPRVPEEEKGTETFIVMTGFIVVCCIAAAVRYWLLL